MVEENDGMYVLMTEILGKVFYSKAFAISIPGEEK